MHYIRLLRPPSLDSRDKLKLVLTITTDLGDSFLCPEQPVPISVCAHLAQQHASDQAETQIKLDDDSIIWRSGLRVLKVELELPPQLLRKMRSVDPANGSPQIRIIASRKTPGPPHIADIPFDIEGRILGLSVPFPRPSQETCYTATREFKTSVDGNAGTLSIDEEIGESIDRHVWDAGVVTTGLFFDMCGDETDIKWRKTPLLQSILTSATSDCPLNVIELGCGVGILGIGLATALSARACRRTSREATEKKEDVLQDSEAMDGSADARRTQLDIGSIHLTDLPDAEELTRGNIIRYEEAQSAFNSGFMELDYESLDWEDGKTGVFGSKASATAWDLIIISDCTYNVDMLSALVDTLSALHTLSVGLGNAGPKVMLATKPRHSSEKALFDVMKANYWKILESATQPLPLLGLDDESVEIYLFEKISV